MTNNTKNKRTRRQISYAEEDYDTDDERQNVNNNGDLDNSQEEDQQPQSKKVKTPHLGTWNQNDSLITFIHKDFMTSLSTTSSNNDPSPSSSASSSSNSASNHDKKITILSFDFDSTLVNTKSGRAFATGPDDWQLWHTSIPAKLKEYQDKGYKLVIFTNQNGVAKGKLTVNALKKRIEGFMNAVGSNIQFLVFAATHEDHFRKPSTGMWKYMETNVLNGYTIDLANSIYVGDAAGRPKGWSQGKKKDHSCGDRKFALNVGIGFSTPEAFFLKQKEYTKWILDGYDIKALEKDNKKAYVAEDLISPKQEVILFVGFPASGKTTFYKRYFEPNGYVHVNRDTLKTPAKCLAACKEALENGKSVVVDNTNPDKNSRSTYIEAAQEYGVPIRCFRFKVDEDLAKHLNVYRENKTLGEHKHVPRVGYAVFKKNFTEPKRSEGFSEVKEIDFVPVFTDEESRQMFYHYT